MIASPLKKPMKAGCGIIFTSFEICSAPQTSERKGIEQSTGKLRMGS